MLYSPQNYFVYRYARDNLVKMEVFIKDTSLDKVVVSEKTKMVWLLASVGGIAGITTGCSLITLCEIVYFIGNWCLHVQHRLRNREVDRIHRRRHRDVLRERRKLFKVKKEITDFDKGGEADNRRDYSDRRAVKSWNFRGNQHYYYYCLFSAQDGSDPGRAARRRWWWTGARGRGRRDGSEETSVEDGGGLLVTWFVVS